MKKEEIADLFKKNSTWMPQRRPSLTAIAREHCAKNFCRPIWVSPAQIPHRRNRTIVMSPTRGNARLSTTLPDLHVAVVGIDKVIPDWESAGLLLRMLARSATGQKINRLQHFITGPRTAEGEYGPRNFIWSRWIMDAAAFWPTRSARNLEMHPLRLLPECLPVYKNVGGFCLGWFIPVPIAQFSLRRFSAPAQPENAFRFFPVRRLCGFCPLKCHSPKFCYTCAIASPKEMTSADGQLIPHCAQQ